MKLGTSAGPMFDDEDIPNVYWEVDAASADTNTSFTAQRPGDYEVVCKTEGHIASGMVGKLTVVPGNKCSQRLIISNGDQSLEFQGLAKVASQRL
jgi:hypothetical protein